MKFFFSLWVLTDNESMDVTQVESNASSPCLEQLESPLSQQTIQARYDYSNIINLIDYLKVKNPAY